MDTTFDSIKEQLADDELEQVAERLLSVTRGLDDDRAVGRAINVSARLRRLGREIADGVVTREAAAVERAQIRLGMVAFVSELEPQARRRRSAPQAPVIFAPPEQPPYEKILGTVSHLRSVGWLRRGLELANAICRLKAPSGAGTGFLLGAGLVLTNHHVLSSESEADAAEVHFGYEEDERRRLQSGHRYRVAPGSWRASEEFDCAVVRLIDDGAKPLESWGRVELGGGTPLRVGDHVTIVQHPEGGAKQIAMTANQVVNVFGHLLHYSTDTMPGSSGSPVFDDQWRVVALHHAGGNLLKNARGERIFANEGVLIDAVVKALELGAPRA